MEISPLELVLDPTNPRFIAPLDEPSQENIRKHLLQYEEVEALAESIVGYGGLRPGERIVVTQEAGRYVILEGNRRVCACQLLLDPRLVPSGYRVVTAYPSTLAAIRTISVDIVDSRDAAAQILASRHIEGARKWGTLSKMGFFVARLERGQSPKEIAQITGIGVSKVKELIQDFYLLKRALSLPAWTDEERSRDLELYGIKATRFTRMFHTERILDRLQVKFARVTLQPKSEIPGGYFDKALELVARATLMSDLADTRKVITEVSGISDLLREIEAISSPEPEGKIGSESEAQPQGESQMPTEGSAPPSQPSAAPDDSRTTPGTSGPAPEEKAEPIPVPVGFFESLSCTGLNTTDPDAPGVLAIAKEIRGMSNNRDLARFPVAAGMLMRSLLEQALKYHLRKAGRWNNVVMSHRDPSLGYLLKYCRDRKSTLFQGTILRDFEALDSDFVKNSLDLNVHQTDVVMLAPDTLKAVAKCGVRAFIQALLK